MVKQYTTIHFSNNNSVGINLAVFEEENGDLSIMRCFQSASSPSVPEIFTLRAEERHGLMEYMQRAFEK